jgi:hypothetical protein
MSTGTGSIAGRAAHLTVMRCASHGSCHNNYISLQPGLFGLHADNVAKKISGPRSKEQSNRIRPSSSGKTAMSGDCAFERAVETSPRDPSPPRRRGQSPSRGRHLTESRSLTINRGGGHYADLHQPRVDGCDLANPTDSVDDLLKGRTITRADSGVLGTVEHTTVLICPE